MEYVEVREMLLQHWKYTGGPNEAHSAEIYHDDRRWLSTMCW